jgi:LETM1 and EF-hand domain-containing protein 1
MPILTKDLLPCFRLLGLSTIGIDFLRIRRIKHHLDFIIMDDKLLSQNAGKNLSSQEIKEALEERGLYVAF